jgi:predicted NAD-dependent protein-ADP-ribosyltransferase YbiA (DUF1768 family)
LFGWVAAAAHADTITDENVAERVAAAKTPADHKALAAFFTAQAEAAVAKVEMHQKMAAAFTGKQQENWQLHCNALIGTYKKQAEAYTALAKEQEQMAGGM